MDGSEVGGCHADADCFFFLDWRGWCGDECLVHGSVVWVGGEGGRGRSGVVVVVVGGGVALLFLLFWLVLFWLVLVLDLVLLLVGGGVKEVCSWHVWVVCRRSLGSYPGEERWRESSFDGWKWDRVVVDGLEGERLWCWCS